MIKMIKRFSRGQGLSLEMVIGLFILLILAAVVVKLILTYISPKVMGTEKTQKQLDIDQFKQNCRTWCSEFQRSGKLDFCMEKFKGNDWNLNDITNELIKVGPAKLGVCEDHVYCFLVEECKWTGGSLGPRACIERLCRHYKEFYMREKGHATVADAEEWASNMTSEVIQPGSCATVNNTWLGFILENNEYVIKPDGTVWINCSAVLQPY